ncbi:MAG: hypothetical protein C0621_06680 [Desulfuromonas sp.]|nr:MAG: hypothetical protein C0621_06680 [Desulfuromonas sp.]
MKKMICAIFLCLLGATVCWGANYGAADSDLGAGDILLSTGYIHLPSEWSAGDYATLLGFSDAPFEVLQSQYYVQAGVGLGGGWQAYLRGGVADLEVEGGMVFTSSDVQGDLGPTVAGGFGGPVYRGKTLTVAPFVQGTYFSSYEDFAVGQVDVTPSAAKTLVDAVERISYKDGWTVEGGLAFELRMEGAQLYFGPLLLGGEMSVEEVVDLADNTVYSDSYVPYVLEPATNVGAFAGIRWPLGEKGVLDLESRMVGGFTVGLSLGTTF